MRRIIDWLLLAAVLGGAGYGACTHKAQVRAAARSMKAQLAPCSSPITYSLGSVDPRFGISTAALAVYLEEAATTWERPAGRDLFEYAPSSGDVTVSLVYDSRQGAADTLKALGISTGQSKASYDALKARYNGLSLRVDAAEAAHHAQAAGYRRREEAYNAKVRHWNRQRGVPEPVYKRLLAEKAALAREFADVKTVENVLNADINTLNALATTLNQLIVQLSLNVGQYNRVGAAMGHFEEGYFKISGGVQTITIYVYSAPVQLVRVLAHELGHALGLEHVNDPEAVMFKINRGADLKVSGSDIAELNRACKAGR
ncbi:MAG: matrixin family metalloprotease [Elusimicrobiota bacterium]